MRKAIVAIALLLAPLVGFASEGGPPLQDAQIDLKDHESLQRGAQYFVDYCMGCHSLQYMRYGRMAVDLGISDADLSEHFLFGGVKPGDLMANAMRPDDGVQWFGTAVPDLTLVTRWRSPDWVYTYLKSFYTDPSRPYGVNNLVFPDVGMPDPFVGLQGIQAPVLAEAHNAEPGAKPHVIGVELVEPGLLSQEDFDAMVRDLTNFLTYVGEPVKLERQQLGIYVLIFLGVLFVLAFLMKKEFWKDVH